MHVVIFFNSSQVIENACRLGFIAKVLDVNKKTFQQYSNINLMGTTGTGLPPLLLLKHALISRSYKMRLDG